MSDIGIFDSSAILAYLHRERGEDIVEHALYAAPCWMSAVNACEVLGKLSDKGMPSAEAETTLNEINITVIDFDLNHARLAAALRARTVSIGASLGDRACLSLTTHAIQMGFTPIVYTAEQAWAKLKWPFKVVVIRGGK